MCARKELRSPAGCEGTEVFWWGARRGTKLKATSCEGRKAPGPERAVAAPGLAQRPPGGWGAQEAPLPAGGRRGGGSDGGEWLRLQRPAAIHHVAAAAEESRPPQGAEPSNISLDKVTTGRSVPVINLVDNRSTPRYALAPPAPLPANVNTN